MWDIVSNWFGPSMERRRLIKDFNNYAKNAFISGEVETLLKAKIISGDPDYSHRLSKFMRGGFDIEALTGKPLPESEIHEIRDKILNNKLIVRKLVTLGWDTLSITDLESDVSWQWNIEAHLED